MDEVTDQLGDTVEEHSYDAWGQRRSLANDADEYEPFADPNVATPQGQLSERYSEELGKDDHDLHHRP